MSLPFLFWSAFLVGFSGAMMPGPVLTATIAEVMKRGFKAGPLIVLGHAMLEICMLAAVVLGLSRWITAPFVKAGLGVGGGALLVLMGAQMALTARRAAEEALGAAPSPKAAIRGPVWSGVLTSISNPYWTIWWATTGLYYAAISLQRGMPGLASFYSGHILSDLVWYSVVAAAVSSGRRVCPAWLYRALIVLCGLALVGLGGFFAAGGLAYFM